MPKSKPPTKDKTATQQVAVRLDADVIGRLDAIAAKLTRPGLGVTRTDAIRIALMTGLEAMEKEK
jgi:predicted transcriptional regulator